MLKNVLALCTKLFIIAIKAFKINRKIEQEMLNYIVLGQVPGTNHYLNFKDVLLVYTSLLLVVAITIMARRILYASPGDTELNPAQSSINSSMPKESSRILFPTLYISSFAIWLIVKYFPFNPRRLRNYLSQYSQ